MITTPHQNVIYLSMSLFILLLSVAIIVLGIILIHELPYKIARKRNHPQQDAIRCMAIMGLVLIPLWLLAMVWAYMRSGVSYFGGESGNNVELSTDDTDSDIDAERENKSKTDNSGDNTEKNEIKIADSDVTVDKNGKNSVESEKNNDKAEVKDSREKFVDDKVDNKDDNNRN